MPTGAEWYAEVQLTGKDPTAKVENGLESPSDKSRVTKHCVA